MLLRQWMTEAGTGLELEFIQKFTDQTLTSTGQLSLTADLENIHSLLSGRWSLVLRLNSCLYQTPAKGDWWLCLTVDDWDVDKKKVVWVLWIMSERTRSLVTPVVCSGVTDVPFLRQGKSAFYCCWIFLGSTSCIPCFSPMNYTPILLQEHNEFINGKILFRGSYIFVFCIFPSECLI